MWKMYLKPFGVLVYSLEEDTGHEKLSREKLA